MLMEILLTEQEARVLGSLLEKEMATPDYYPLSLNALTNACNQKSNRHPVVSYEETTVVRALDGLQEKGLARQTNVSRVPKYEQHFTGPRNLVRREAAVISVLLLRGPQTLGEIRGRTERLYSFTDLEETEKTLETMLDLGYAAKLPRQPGRKEFRYAHLLSGQPLISADELTPAPEAATLEVRATDEKIAELKEKIETLQTELAELRHSFFEFKKQLE